MTYMRSWKSHRLTSHTWLGLNPQIGRPLKDCRAIGLFSLLCDRFWRVAKSSKMVTFVTVAM
jgi:hypothetical protein